MDPLLEPQVFTRHTLRLHALLIDSQPWLCLRDLGRLMNLFFDDRIARKLAPDQRRYVTLNRYGEAQETLMVSESGMYALLVHHGHAVHQPLRKWLNYSVLPRLREAHGREQHDRPTPGVLEWQTGELSVMHWQNERWIRLRDMPCLLPGREALEGGRGGWWQSVKARLLWKAR